MVEIRTERLLRFFRVLDVGVVDAVALEWRESESRVRAAGPFNNRADVGHLFSRAT
jgi:hypothetical protein